MAAESSPPASDQKYVAVIGDIRHSRRAKDRAGLQRKFRQAVSFLNDELVAELQVPAALTAGDEIQALMRMDEGEFVPKLLDDLSDSVRPSVFTFGIGLGPITTDLSPSVAEIDGPAFHNAREALRIARFEGFWAATQGFGDDDELISCLFGLMGSIRKRWTNRQIEIMGVVEDMSRSEAAVELGVSPSVVTESLQAASAGPYYRGRELLVRTFRKHTSKVAP